MYFHSKYKLCKKIVIFIIVDIYDLWIKVEMYKSTVMFEYKIATAHKSGEILNNEMAVVNRLKVHRYQTG